MSDALFPTLPVTIAGALAADDAKDFYAVTLSADRRLLARMTSLADADFDLILFDAEGTQLIGTENGVGVVELIVYTVTGEPATLYVCVSQWAGIGPYTLELSDSPIARWLLDSFTGGAGTPLSAPAGKIGATWTDGHGGYAAGASGFTLASAYRFDSGSGTSGDGAKPCRSGADAAGLSRIGASQYVSATPAPAV